MNIPFDSAFLHNIVPCLKIAEISINMPNNTAKEKMIKFLKWSHDEYIFVGAAVAFAAKTFTRSAQEKDWRVSKKGENVLNGC